VTPASFGSGPIVIGQAAEFDSSGVQACEVLREVAAETPYFSSGWEREATDEVRCGENASVADRADAVIAWSRSLL
jgi:hypothetical protein